MVAAPVHATDPEFGVYLRLVDAAPGDFEAMVAAVGPAIDRAGWKLVASYDASCDCRFRARVFVVHPPAYAAAVLALGSRAAFALPLRLAVFEDEPGVHLAAVNPQSIARTIVAETGFETPPAELVAALTRMVSSGFPGTPVLEQFGQLRSKGRIEKTMGIVAGGPFATKIETVAAVRGKSPAEVADRVSARAKSAAGRWGLRPVYRLDLPEQGVVLLGLTGAAMEARAFGIVGAGGDAKRNGYACPGVDHAAAFPVELLIVQEGTEVKVLLIDEMFRMKLYFEDAGRMKFAANMQMPGSIEAELRDLLEDDT
jgi:hypothetical protein